MVRFESKWMLQLILHKLHEEAQNGIVSPNDLSVTLKKWG
jgi:hypothetical protein